MKSVLECRFRQIYGINVYTPYQLYWEATRHTLEEAIERYFKEQTVSVVKRGHLFWWKKELGFLYLQDVRPAVIVEKKQKPAVEDIERYRLPKQLPLNQLH